MSPVKGYFEWMCSVIKENGERVVLLEELYHTEFYAIIAPDDNRLSDGADLSRAYERYCEENGTPISEAEKTRLDVARVSVLEVMVALAIRMETTIMCDVDFGDRTQLWFWAMIKSLGLYGMTNDSYDKCVVDDIIGRFLEREYEHDGKGGLFHVKNTLYNMTEVEIWGQMHLFIEGLS